MASPSESRRKNKYTSQGFLIGHWGSRGGFGSIPAEVIDGPDWISLSFSASKILMVLVRMYRGWNNGDLSATQTLMDKYNVTSSATLSKALQELQDKGLIVKTQHGYRGSDGTRKPNLYALAWLPIDEIGHKNDGEWIPKIKGTRAALRMDFTKPYAGGINYEAA
ncbi:hypothetical protein [uncultured Tolumonas sp.]|uniref:hypothetical protein n=1 Tax=uncultured Tolumonas sp. TaxID=263765 RepID=UPI002930F019|nr:hypothetical protein [uncultured Tolumonas sp.]